MTVLDSHFKFRAFRRRKARAPSPLTIYARAWREARGVRRDLVLVFALGLLGTPLSLLTPLPIKLIVDSVIGTAPLPAWLAALVPLAPGSEALFGLAIALSVTLVAL